jgi:hypothetical protein
VVAVVVLAELMLTTSIRGVFGRIRLSFTYRAVDLVSIFGLSPTIEGYAPGRPTPAETEVVPRYRARASSA